MHTCQQPPAALQRRLSTRPLTARCVPSPRRRQAHAGPVVVTEAGSSAVPGWPPRWATPPKRRRALQQLTTELTVLSLTVPTSAHSSRCDRARPLLPAARSRTERALPVGGASRARLNACIAPRPALPNHGTLLSCPRRPVAAADCGRVFKSARLQQLSKNRRPFVMMTQRKSCSREGFGRCFVRAYAQERVCCCQ